MNRREFLTEAAVVVVSQAIAKADVVSNDGTYTATILKVDKANSNGNIYPRDVVKNAIDELGDRVLLGELWQGSYTIDSIVHFANASHEIRKVYLEGDDVKAVIKPLNTPQGHVLKSLLKDNASISFRPRGKGLAKKMGDVLVIESDYSLISIDAMPSDKAAKL